MSYIEFLIEFHRPVRQVDHILVALTLRTINSWLLLPSGEATLAFVEWCNAGKKLYHESLLNQNHLSAATPSTMPLPRRNLITPVAFGPEFPRPQIIAADPVSAAPFIEL